MKVEVGWARAPMVDVGEPSLVPKTRVTMFIPALSVEEDYLALIVRMIN